MRICPYSLLSAVALLIAPVLAQSPREIAIITGRGELLQFERDIERGGDLRAEDRRRHRGFAARDHGQRQERRQSVAGRVGRRFGAHAFQYQYRQRQQRGRALAQRAAERPAGGSAVERQRRYHRAHRHCKRCHRGEAHRRPGVGAGQEGGQPAADAARSRAAADSVAGEVRQHRSRGAAGARIQPVQPQRQKHWRNHHRAICVAALQPAPVSEPVVLEYHRQFRRSVEPVRISSGSRYRRDDQGIAAAGPAADSGRAEPGHAGRQGSQLPGRRLVPLPRADVHVHGRRHRAGRDGAVQAVRRTAQFHADDDHDRARSI